MEPVAPPALPGKIRDARGGKSCHPFGKSSLERFTTERGPPLDGPVLAGTVAPPSPWGALRRGTVARVNRNDRDINNPGGEETRDL